MEQYDDNRSLALLGAALERETSDGAALLHNIGDNPICCVTLDPSVPFLLVDWRGYASSLQFRFIHESILVLLRQHRLKKILGDDTNLPMVHADDQAWVVEDWLPRAIAAGLSAVANNSPAAHFGRVSVSNMKSRIAEKIVLRTFEDLQEARLWLKDVPV